MPFNQVVELYCLFVVGLRYIAVSLVDCNGYVLM